MQERCSTKPAFQQYKGIFCGPLVVKTFAHHFTSTRGALKMPGLSVEKPERGGLVLSAVSVRDRC